MLSSNALRLASSFRSHRNPRRVAAVLCPGLQACCATRECVACMHIVMRPQSHPQHTFAANHMNFGGGGGGGYGGMMCVRLKIAQGADALSGMRTFVCALRVVECT